MVIESTPRVDELRARLSSFMDEHVFPAETAYARHLTENDRWSVPPIMEDLKARARGEGLWNLFLPDEELAIGLTNLEYAPLCEVMGRSPIGPEVFNCNAPDTGNMEVLWKYGTDAQKEQWLVPLLAGEIRSAFCMTEPDVASSDATNVRSSIKRDGDDYVINGRKWWISNSMHPDCNIYIFMGKTDENAPKHKQQSQILMPADTPGVEVLRPMTLFGYDDAPHGHGEIIFRDVRVPAENLILGEGRGFEIAQGRLGPGRVHHCMRLIGAAERALEAMCKRARSRKAFGMALADHESLRFEIAACRMEIEQSRLLVLKTAYMMDQVDSKEARAEIAMIKVVVPNMALAVLDRSMQAHGAGGFSGDFGLAHAWASARGLRMADGPDAVHSETVAKLELRKYS
ncbi:MAG TPA: acyl-CoA dehydrogenase family protein [Alphaproteobacteria bacterium]|jgi:acyl-CoA dehydrogenase|nr:acyl-CoA dehydrogenase family protein [Alphaproteobacteria bacterium]